MASSAKIHSRPTRLMLSLDQLGCPSRITVKKIKKLCLTSVLYFHIFRTMELKTATTMLSALAHDTRLTIFKLLVVAGTQGKSIGEIRSDLQIPGPTLTAHLNILRQANLVMDTRDGRVIRAQADYTQMDALLAYLMENCCQSDTSKSNAKNCCPPNINPKMSRKR
jgi:ArsR family transcriptional regulator, arsenate/arsenite/antimonite-responsive transcriptional repressor